LPRLDEYLALLRHLDEADLKDKHAIFRSDMHMSVADLTGELTDEYLNFCERALVRPKDDRSGVRNILEDYFPVGTNKATEVNIPREVPGKPKLPANLPNENDAEGAGYPGEWYSILNGGDVLGTAAETYEQVVRRGSGWAGVDEEYMSRVVEKYEWRVVRWWRKRTLHRK